MKKSARYVLAAAAFAALANLFPAAASAADTTVEALAGRTHFHGIGFAGTDTARLHLASHHGLWLVEADGRARRLSDHGDDLMGFTPHPTDPATLFASGHPAGGGNLGFVVSTDAGRTWKKRADGVGGPVDFHQMDVSRADPRTIWGVHAGLQRSDDGGATWRRVGPSPSGLFALAGSGRSVDALYGATRGGLLRSADGGRTWQPAHPVPQPATTVHVTGGGAVIAYIVGVGLVQAPDSDGALAWRVVGPGPQGAYILHLAAAADARTLAAVTFDPKARRQSVAVSADGGVRWRALGAGSHRR